MSYDSIAVVSIINRIILNMKKIIAFGIALSPAIAFAQVDTVGSSQGIRTVGGLVYWISSAFNIATGLILAAAVVFFLWGVFQYVMAAGDEDAQKTGRAHIINGIIGIAVMVSVWGLVNFLTRSANLGGSVEQAPALPTIQG